MDKHHNRQVIEWLCRCRGGDGQCWLPHLLPIFATLMHMKIFMPRGARHTEIWCYAVHNPFEKRDVIGHRGPSELARRSVDNNFTHAGEFSNYDECS